MEGLMPQELSVGKSFFRFSEFFFRCDGAQRAWLGWESRLRRRGPGKRSPTGRAGPAAPIADVVWLRPS
jgi:hypothetical protein